MPEVFNIDGGLVDNPTNGTFNVSVEIGLLDAMSLSSKAYSDTTIEDQLFRVMTLEYDGPDFAPGTPADKTDTETGEDVSAKSPSNPSGYDGYRVVVKRKKEPNHEHRQDYHK